MTVDSESEHEAFLAELIDKSLAAYDDGQSDLARLVRAVESGIDALAAVSDVCWVAELRQLWGRLEIIYAVMLDEGRSSLSDDEQREVTRAVAGLRSLVKPA